MTLLPVLAALGASFGWASGIVIAQGPAKRLGAFTFTHIQLIACAALVAALVTALGHWHTVPWQFWPAYVFSSVFGILLGNLAMIACLRRGGPRRTELLLSLKAPIVGGFAFLWLREVPSSTDILGAAIALTGVCLAIVFGTNDQSKSDAKTAPLLHIVGLGVVATALQGAGFLAMKPALEAGLTPIAATALRLLGAAALMSLLAFWPSKAVKPQASLTPSLLGLTILPGVIGYIFASSLLLFAFAHLDAGIAATLGALSPVLILPILWAKERLTPHPAALLGALTAVSGTAIIALL